MLHISHASRILYGCCLTGCLLLWGKSYEISIQLTGHYGQSKRGGSSVDDQSVWLRKTCITAEIGLSASIVNIAKELCKGQEAAVRMDASITVQSFKLVEHYKGVSRMSVIPNVVYQHHAPVTCAPVGVGVIWANNTITHLYSPSV